MYGRNVFALFPFGPGADDKPPKSESTNRLDTTLHSLLSLKRMIRDTARIVTVHHLAAEKDMTPEDMSMELYGKNVLSEVPDDASEEEKSP